MICGIPLPIFSEWWLAKEKFSTIEAFIISSFPGATCQGCNGLSIKYQGICADIAMSNMSTSHLKHLFLSKLLFLQDKRLKRDAGIKDVKSPGDPKFMDAFALKDAILEGNHRIVASLKEKSELSISNQSENRIIVDDDDLNAIPGRLEKCKDSQIMKA
ncbi:unnamed protein product [Camellia sinensis]